MTKRDELLDLAERVEANESVLVTELRDAVGVSTSKMIAIGWGIPNAATSLDAATALHDAVLPGWEFLIHNDSVAVGNPLETNPEWASAKTTPAAWVAAILRAKAEELK
jgi:hypothetical protein